MKMDDSIVIEQKSGERFAYYYLKYFLEMCGHSVLEDKEGVLKSRNNASFTRIILGEQGVRDDAICLPMDEEEALIEKLCSYLVEDKADEESLDRVKSMYNTRICQCLYNLEYLFSSRNTEYRCEVIQEITKELGNVSKEKDKFSTEETGTLRDIYSYVYTANKVNEAMYKRRGVMYRRDPLFYSLKKLERARPNRSIYQLLRANVMNNTAISNSDILTYYQKLYQDSSYGIRLEALYNSAVIQAQWKKRNYGIFERCLDDEKCVHELKAYEPAREFFQRVVELRPNDLKSLYNLGVMNEKQALSQGNASLNTAEDLFYSVARKIESLPEKERNVDEFQLLYHAYLRLCHINQLKGQGASSLQYLDQAEALWQNLQENMPLPKMYKSEEEKQEVYKILDERYKSRAKIFYKKSSGERKS